MLDRAIIIESLAARLPRHECIRAASLGGSDANGRADELSDVDVFLIVEPGTIERSVEALEAEIRALSPIRLRFRLPMPTWHGFHQAFYQLEHAPEHLMIDWVMIERGTPHPWLEVERHGTHRVLFDKDGVMQPARVDRAAVDAVVRRKVEELRVKFPMFRHLPEKLARRGLPADAAHFYHALVLRPLVDLLRAVYCPDRHDFGFRYVRDDLPREAYEAVCRLAFPDGPGRLGALVAEAGTLFEATLRRWDTQMQS